MSEFPFSSVHMLSVIVTLPRAFPLKTYLQVKFCRSTFRGFIAGWKDGEVMILNFMVPVTENSVRQAGIFLGEKINFQTYHYLPFKSVHPVLSLICFITARYFNMGTICLGVHEQTGSSSVICGRLLILYQEYFYRNKNISKIPSKKQIQERLPIIENI